MVMVNGNWGMSKTWKEGKISLSKFTCEGEENFTVNSSLLSCTKMSAFTLT